MGAGELLRNGVAEVGRLRGEVEAERVVTGKLKSALNQLRACVVNGDML